jgi:hypothetical protein
LNRTFSCTLAKTDDRLILGDISRDSPVSVSTGGDPLRKISKVVAPRDTKQLLGTRWGLDSKEEGILNPVALDRWLEGWSGAVVLVEYLALVYAHNPVESDYEE